MALVKNCRAYPTHVIAEKGLQHPTHWLISTQVRALEAWVHLFPFREAHTHTCIAPHGERITYGFFDIRLRRL